MSMFRAESHPFLVADDGKFEVAKARTTPPKKSAKKYDADDWKEKLAAQSAKLGDSQHRLYSRGRSLGSRRSQALDAAGKDGTIRHVFGGVNPCGLHVASFKAAEPSSR